MASSLSDLLARATSLKLATMGSPFLDYQIIIPLLLETSLETKLSQTQSKKTERTPAGFFLPRSSSILLEKSWPASSKDLQNRHESRNIQTCDSFATLITASVSFTKISKFSTSSLSTASPPRGKKEAEANMERHWIAQSKRSTPPFKATLLRKLYYVMCENLLKV